MENGRRFLGVPVPAAMCYTLTSVHFEILALIMAEESSEKTKYPKYEDVGTKRPQKKLLPIDSGDNKGGFTTSEDLCHGF